MTHYHYGYGLAGYGPEGETTHQAPSLSSLATDLAHEIGEVCEGLHDQIGAYYREAVDLLAQRPSGGGDPVGYPGSWESIASAAVDGLRAWEMMEDLDTLALNLENVYRSVPEMRAPWLETQMLPSFPLVTDIHGDRRLYAWACDRWECGLAEPDQDYTVPAASREGGYVHCPCLVCPEIVIYTPGTDQAPYCGGCREAECHERDEAGCLRTDEMYPQDAS